MKSKILLKIFAAMIFAGGIFAFNFLPTPETPAEKNNPPQSQSEKILPTVTQNSVQAAEIFYNGTDEAIQSILNDGSEYAVYLRYPGKTSAPFIYNARQMRSASMIKVFILATVMEIVKDGNLSLDQNITLHDYDKVGGAGVLAGYASGPISLRTVLKLMITESDNTATNMVIDLVGMQTINDYIREKGYNDTILQRKMMDTDAIYAGRENYTSARDLGEIFLKIYNRQCVSPECDDVMLNFLLEQHDTECFNTALPGLQIAHKTGALAGTFDDGGIIYGGSQGDVILVIMTENYTGEKTVIGRMKEFARYAVYR